MEPVDIQDLRQMDVGGFAVALAQSRGREQVHE